MLRWDSLFVRLLFALFDSLMHYYNKSGGKHDFGAVAMHPYVRALDLHRT